MLDLQKIKEITERGRSNKFEVTMKEFAYCCLLNNIADLRIAYRIIYGDVKDENIVSIFNESPMIIWLKTEIKRELNLVSVNSISDISFEDNKAGQVELLTKLDSYVEEGRIKEKDAIALENQIRSNLVSKFSTSKRADEQYIIVNTKFNDVCWKCGAEVSVCTKENAMTKWDLIDNNKNIKIDDSF